MIFSHKKKIFRVRRALVDTGSDISILPLDIAHYLEIELDDSKRIAMDSAGGGMFIALPSRQKVDYSIEEEGFRPIRWRGTVYFAEEEPVVLLGHHECLEQFDLSFHGPEKKLGILPRFRA